MLSVRYAKAVYVYNPSSRAGALSIEERDRRTVIAAVPRLVETLELAVPEDRIMLSIVVEDESGTQAKTYGIASPS